MRRNKEPKPRNGDMRIVEVTRNDGFIMYEVESYSYHNYEGPAVWGGGEPFRNAREARKYIEKIMGERVKSRRVIWP